jgi:hypothetical protein
MTWNPARLKKLIANFRVPDGDSKYAGRVGLHGLTYTVWGVSSRSSAASHRRHFYALESRKCDLEPREVRPGDVGFMKVANMTARCGLAGTGPARLARLGEGGPAMSDQQSQCEESKQDGRRDRRVKWATVCATTIDAVSKLLEIIIRR